MQSYRIAVLELQSPVLQDHSTRCNSSGSSKNGSYSNNTRFSSSSNNITNSGAGSDTDTNSAALNTA